MTNSVYLDKGRHQLHRTKSTRVSKSTDKALRHFDQQLKNVVHQKLVVQKFAFVAFRGDLSDDLGQAAFEATKLVRRDDQWVLARFFAEFRRHCFEDFLESAADSLVELGCHFSSASRSVDEELNDFEQSSVSISLIEVQNED